MATNKRIPALNVKIKEYKRVQDGKGIELLTHEDLYQGKYAYLQLNDPKYYKDEDFSFYCKTCLSNIDAKGNKWLIGSLNKGALNNLFSLNFTKDNKPDVEAESKWIDGWVANGCLFMLPVNDNPTLSHIVEKTQGYLFEVSENTVLPFTKEDKELISKIDNAIAYQLEHQDTLEEYYDSSDAIPAFFFSEDELKRLRIKHTPEYEGEFPNKLVSKLQLPEIEERGNRKGSGKGGGTYNNYMSTQERLESVLDLLEGKNKEKFDLLYAHYQDDSNRTAFALALTGLTVHQKSATNLEPENSLVSNGHKPTSEIEVENQQTKEPTKGKRRKKEENNGSSTQIEKQTSETEDEDSSYPVVSSFITNYPGEIIDLICDEAKLAISELADDSYDDDTKPYLELLTKVLSFPIQGKTYPAREVKRTLTTHGYTSPILCYNFEELEIMAEKLGVLEVAEV